MGRRGRAGVGTRRAAPARLLSPGRLASGSQLQEQLGALMHSQPPRRHLESDKPARRAERGFNPGKALEC